MANPEHLEILQRGVKAWNKWRRANPTVRPDLSGDAPVDAFEEDLRLVTSAVLNELLPGKAPADGTGLTGSVLNGIDFRRTNLARARLDNALLIEANLSGADLSDASLTGSVLSGANLKRVNAIGADFGAATLRWARLNHAKLKDANFRLANADGIVARYADLRRANLFYASFVGADLRHADLSGATVYGVSAWDVDVTDAVQDHLVITTGEGAEVTVDDLQIAQFLHLIIANQRLRTVIDTLTTKVVLILGRFTPERKPVLDAVHQALRARGFVPVMFDFDRPATRDFTETITTLAHLARFIVADLTDPASLPKELEAIVPRLAVPLVPLLEQGSSPYAMFSDYWKYDWVLDIVEYRTSAGLVRYFDRLVLRPAEEAVAALSARRTSAVRGIKRRR